MTRERYDDHESSQRLPSPSTTGEEEEESVPAGAKSAFVPIARSNDTSPGDSVGLPTVYETDGETDVEILRSVPKQFAITDEKTANWLVKRIQQSREYAARVKIWAAQELRRSAREEQTLLFLFGRQIERWTKDEIAKLNGKRKSLSLPGGTVGYRTVPTRLVVDDETRVIQWAHRNLPAAIVVVEKLSKTTLNEYAEKTGDIPDAGVHVEPRHEKFYIR